MYIKSLWNVLWHCTSVQSLAIMTTSNSHHTLGNLTDCFRSFQQSMTDNLIWIQFSIPKDHINMTNVWTFNNSVHAWNPSTQLRMIFTYLNYEIEKEKPWLRKESLKIDDYQVNQYQQNKQLALTSIHWIQKRPRHIPIEIHAVPGLTRCIISWRKLRFFKLCLCSFTGNG
jgi:hypothetical protein